MWLYDWSEEGLEIQCIGDDILGKLVPPHVNIFYCFGGGSGSSMVSALILHAFRVYLTGGFKKARELIWMTGIILGVCTVLFGVTGY